MWTLSILQREKEKNNKKQQNKQKQNRPLSLSPTPGSGDSRQDNLHQLVTSSSELFLWQFDSAVRPWANWGQWLSGLFSFTSWITGARAWSSSRPLSQAHSQLKLVPKWKLLNFNWGQITARCEVVGVRLSSIKSKSLFGKGQSTASSMESACVKGGWSERLRGGSVCHLQ